MDLPSFYDYLLAASGYLKALQEKNTPENQRRLDRLMEFKSIIQDYLHRAEENGVEPSLSGFLEEMALDEQLGDQDDEEDCREKKPKEERIQMMTMHGAKGLEFPVVFLIAMEDGVFPGQRAIGEEVEMEEERRLCYVAMTRAKRELHICAAASRMLYGRTTASRPSRFLGEVPGNLVEQSGTGRSGWTDHSSVAGDWDWDESPERYHSAGTTRSGGYESRFSSEGFAGRSSYFVGGYSNRSGGSAGQYRGGGYPGTGFGGTSRPSPSGQSGTRVPGRSSSSGYTASAKSGPSLPEYHKGDMVRHKAFGRGMVLSIQKTGGDALIEIAFDDVGTKRLMLKFAAQQMTKES